MDKLLSKIKISEISVATTIAVTGLSISLVACVLSHGDIAAITGIAGGLSGYVGGRTQGAIENLLAKQKMEAERR